MNKMGKFSKSCKYCHDEIEMSDSYDEEGKWFPYELGSDGQQRHECRKDEPYETECKYCDEPIEISKKSGRWLPYNFDEDGESSDEVHRCKSERRVEEKKI